MPTIPVSARRELFAALAVLLYAAVGTNLLVTMPGWSWLIAGLATFMYGQAFGRLASSLDLARVRVALGFPTIRVYQAMCVSYILFGGFVIIGAFSSLHRVFALIVAYGAFWWVWMWVVLLRRSAWMGSL